MHNPQTCRKAGNRPAVRRAKEHHPTPQSRIPTQKNARQGVESGRTHRCAPTLGVRYRRSGQALYELVRTPYTKIMHVKGREQAPALHRFVQYGQPYKL